MDSPLFDQLQVCREAERTIGLSVDEQLEAMEGQRIGTLHLGGGQALTLRVSRGGIVDDGGRELAQIPDLDLLEDPGEIVRYLRSTAKLPISALFSEENGFHYVVPEIN